MKYILIAALFICFTASVNSQPVFTHKEIKKDSKKPKWELSLSYPQIVNPFNEGEKGFNETVRQRFYAERDTFIVWMKDWEVTKGSEEVGSYYEAGDTVMYSSTSFISVHVYCDSYFSSAAHPNNWSFSINYDLTKNKEVRIDDLYTGDYLKVLSDFCIKEIKKQKYELDSTMQTDDEWLNTGAGPDAKNFEVFNPTKEGLLITFITYQVASYAEGPMEVLVPYSVLKEYVRKGSAMEKINK
jgi:hypothetical protein